MTDAGQVPSTGSLVCPFVALAEDRDRRADAPDEGNRCYAEKAPRRRDLMHQAEYCYATKFASCSVFLAWAARNAAEPAYVRQAAQRAWGSGVAMPEPSMGGDRGGSAGGVPAGDMALGATGGPHGAGGPAGSGSAWGDAGTPGTSQGGPGEGAWPGPTPESGLFGPPEPSETVPARPPSELLDWVSASAWADAPWDPEGEEETEELESSPDDEVEEVELEDVTPEAGEALHAHRVPAALPMPRRRQQSEPIRARGSGEWLYADPPTRQPLVGRRTDIGSPILLAILGLLVVALIVFLLPTILGGGGDDGDRLAAGASPSAAAPVFVLPTRAPADTPQPSPSPSTTPEPEIRTYIVKPGDTLSGIAANPRVRVPLRLLQCINGLANPNLIQPGQELLIPPEGYSCPAGWRRGGTPATPAPPVVTPDQATAEPSAAT